MQINDRGFYEPIGFSDKCYSSIKRLCPGIHINNCNIAHTSVWGNVKYVYNAWATDKDIRYSSASGGVTTALAVYLLESGRVNGVLHAGVCNKNYLCNKLYLSHTREEIIQHTGSRYAPVMMFDRLFDLLDNEDGVFAFIGKPCDVAVMRAVVSRYPQYKNRIHFFLSIFCAGMPSYNATKKAISTFSVDCTPTNVNYRGKGWPGLFTVDFDDGSRKSMSYDESWGKFLGRDLGLRCKICPDGIGLQSDISSGDSWNIKDGFPDFTESDGKNFCFIRTEIGKRLFDEACDAGYITREDLNISVVKIQQPYQYMRRYMVGWRIAVVQLLTGGLLHFRGMKTYKIGLRANYFTAIHDMLGTAKRLLKTKRQWEARLK